MLIFSHLPYVDKQGVHRHDEEIFQNRTHQGGLGANYRTEEDIRDLLAGFYS